MTNVFQPVTNLAQSATLFESVKSQWLEGATVYENKLVGFQGGGHHCSVYWQPTLRIWGVFEATVVSGRFWICLGERRPKELNQYHRGDQPATRRM